MGKEIERKFLVKGDEWRKGALGIFYRQGYFITDSNSTVRVRVSNTIAYLTIKGPSKEITRTEFEYKIPLSDAEEMLEGFCKKPLIEKTRYVVEFDGMNWEIDEFEGMNQGLILAEIELETADQKMQLPPWIDKEVSMDPRYYNSHLVKFPYSRWGKS